MLIFLLKPASGNLKRPGFKKRGLYIPDHASLASKGIDLRQRNKDGGNDPANQGNKDDGFCG